MTEKPDAYVIENVTCVPISTLEFARRLAEKMQWDFSIVPASDAVYMVCVG